MLKKWSRVALLAAATAFVLAAFGACSDGSSGDSGPSVRAQYESSDGDVLTFYDNDTFVLAGSSKAAAVARAIGKTITGTYTGDPVSGTGLVLTASDGTKIVVVELSGSTLKITVDGTAYDLTKKSGGSGSPSSSASMKLPAPVGTNPLTAGASYSVEPINGMVKWSICFAGEVPVILGGWYPSEHEDYIEVDPTSVTVEGSTLVSKEYHEGTEYPNVLNYSYDSGKRELYVQLSKAYIGYFDGKHYYGGKEAYVEWMLDGSAFVDEDYWKGQEDKLDELADIIFSQVHTYGYEKDEATGVIKLTLKSEMTCVYDTEHATHVTLTPKEK